MQQQWTGLDLRTLTNLRVSYMEQLEKVLQSEAAWREIEETRIAITALSALIIKKTALPPAEQATRNLLDKAAC